MTYVELYKKCLNENNIPEQSVIDWRPAEPIFCGRFVANGLVLWLQNGGKLLYTWQPMGEWTVEELEIGIHAVDHVFTMTNKEAAVIIEEMLMGTALMGGRGNGKTFSILRKQWALVKAIELLDKTPESKDIKPISNTELPASNRSETINKMFDSDRDDIAKMFGEHDLRTGILYNKPTE